MASLLYAEIYLICIIIIWLCLYWLSRRSSYSAAELWQRRSLILFLISFSANFLFTVFNGIRLIPPLLFPASYLFKTIYHAALCMGVFAWSAYADTECRDTLFQERKTLILVSIPLVILEALILANLWTYKLFLIDETGAYIRGPLFQVEMAVMTAGTTVFSFKLLRQSLRESDPLKKGHQRQVASFPLCLVVAWLMSFMGESVPIICVSITIELLCLFMGASNEQISMDKLTQVNNRQNLLGFLEYKLVNHDEKLFLLMMDLDYFKSINDTYGHLEGDDALIRAANALKSACGNFKRRPYIARYGGDEFIVVIESTKNDADLLIGRIRETINESNARANRPYTLAFSIGVGEYHPGMSANDLIEAADSALYEIKRARPSRNVRH